MRKIIILFILISSILIGSEDNSNKSEFGLAAGPSIGYGLSFKTRLNQVFAVRFSGGVFNKQLNYSEHQDENDNDLTYNIGIELDYSVKKSDYMDFYFSLGLVHAYESEYNYDYDYEQNRWVDEYFKDYDTRLVVGLGISRYFYDIISISIEAHQVFEYSINASNNSKEFNIYPMLGITTGFLF